MSSIATQENREASLKTDLGKDKLVLTGFDVQEGISEIFSIEVNALSDDGDIDFSKIMGTGCSVTFSAGADQSRVFHGVLAEAEWTGAAERRHSYRLLLRAWPWLLAHAYNCRIFENKTVEDIIKKVFTDHSLGDFRFDLTGSVTMEYCVQYRESDLDFVTRLMEENGYYFYFEHTESKHTLVIVNRSSSHKPVPGLSKLSFHTGGAAHQIGKQYLDGWRKQRRFSTVSSVYNEYNYATPRANMKVDKAGPTPSSPAPKPEFYDYPGRYKDSGGGTPMVQARQEAFTAVDQHRYGVGVAHSLTPGYLVSLEEHPTSGENKQYLVLRCHHQFRGQLYQSDAGEEPRYDGSYEFLPASVQYRAPFVTPKPRIASTQTGRVAGKGEIDVDKEGRILVEFFWERDKLLSRRVRIAQVWSGAKWGGIFIPRVGMEVVVTFLEGDPDQPLVIGTVYNDENKPPYPLPDEKNIAGLKSKSVDGSGYNEFIFDDTVNEEKIRTHAEKDLEVTVENTETRTINGRKLTSPKGTYARKTVIEKGDEVFDIKSGHRTVTIDQGDDTLEVKLGNRTATMKLGKDHTEAMQSITLKCGPSKIVINPMGVTIEGPMITIKGTAMIDTNAPMTNIKSDAMTIVKGGVVMIN